jgi:hypothetical protein
MQGARREDLLEPQRHRGRRETQRKIKMAHTAADLGNPLCALCISVVQGLLCIQESVPFGKDLQISDTDDAGDFGLFRVMPG